MNNKTKNLCLLASLLLINSDPVRSQTFHTCIPEKDWLIDMLKKEKLVPEEPIKETWKVVKHLTITSPKDEFIGLLEAGKYRVTAAGAGGSKKVQEFILKKKSEYKACVGAGGGGGGGAYEGGGGGGGGGVGYKGYYSGGGIYYNTNDHKDQGGGGGYGGDGCYGGGGGNHGEGGGGGGGGAGSYFAVANIELILKGGDGKPGYKLRDNVYNGGDGAGPDGYVIIERWE